MRTIVDLPEEQLEALAEICRRQDISRAEAIRRAVAQFTRQRLAEEPHAAFGLWRDRGVEGVEYERRLRGEWGDALLVTRNTRDFPEGDPGVRIPYSLPI